MSDAFVHTPVDKDRFAKHSGVRLTDVGIGFAKAEMEISPYHLNGLGILHGGAIFTLADIAFAAACNSHGYPAVAVQVNISFFKAVQGGTMTASATEKHRNRKLSVYQIDVFDENEELIASMQGTAYHKKP